MKRPLYFSLLSAILFSLLIIQCSPEEEKREEMSHQDWVNRGKYLVTLGGCNDCHSPKSYTAMGPMADTTRLLSGHPANEKLPQIDPELVKPGNWILGNQSFTAYVGPWGISYASNLTPDNPTGIGSWTDEIFIKALRTGKHMGSGRQILPPMPWQQIGQLTDEDLKAIFTYLQSLPPVNNMVPDPVPPDQIGSR